jgi:hypothetical protein
MATSSATDWNEVCMATIAKLYGDDALRNEFMKHARTVVAGNATSQADFANFLRGPKIGLPDDLADDLSKLNGDALYKFVGQYVCQYLW